MGKLSGAAEVHHGGGLQGFQAQLSRYPEQGLTVVVLANASPLLEELVPNALARDIAQIYLGEVLAPRQAARSIALPEGTLQDFVGRYDYGSRIATVSREGTHLFVQVAGQRRLEVFPKSESGRVVRAVHRQGGGPSRRPVWKIGGRWWCRRRRWTRSWASTTMGRGVCWRSPATGIGSSPS